MLVLDAPAKVAEDFDEVGVRAELATWVAAERDGHGPGRDGVSRDAAVVGLRSAHDTGTLVDGRDRERHPASRVASQRWTVDAGNGLVGVRRQIRVLVDAADLASLVGFAPASDGVARRHRIFLKQRGRQRLRCARVADAGRCRATRQCDG